MTTSSALILLILGLAIVAGLAVYAHRLCQEVRRREAFRQEELQRAHENCLENLELVAAALLQGQVDITEGAWRCKTLLDILDPRLIERAEFQAFDEVYQRTRHLHTHSARQALTPRERFREDKERLAVEDEWRDGIISAAGQVLDFRQRWPASLH